MNPSWYGARERWGKESGGRSSGLAARNKGERASGQGDRKRVNTFFFCLTRAGEGVFVVLGDAAG